MSARRQHGRRRVLVARRTDLGGRDVEAPPVLAVEVLSEHAAVELTLEQARGRLRSSPDLAKPVAEPQSS